MANIFTKSTRTVPPLAPPGPPFKNTKLTAAQLSNALKSGADTSSREHVGLSDYDGSPISSQQTLWNRLAGLVPTVDNEHKGVNYQDNLAQLVKNVSSQGSANINKALSSMGSGGEGSIAATAPVQLQNPFEDPYNQLIAAAQKIGAGNLQDISDLAGKVPGYYQDAIGGVNNQATTGVNGVVSEANALGVNPEAYAGGQNANIQQINARTGQDEADHQAWWDKMKSLRGSELDNLYVGLTHEKAQEMAQWSIAQAARDLAAQQAASGSGRSGGDGGSSGSGLSSLTGSETATQTDLLNDPNFTSVYNTIQDPDTQAAFLANHILSGSNPDAKLAQTQYDTASSIAKSPLGGVSLTGWPGASTWKAVANAKTKAQNDAAMALKLRQLALGLGGTAGVPSSKQTVTTTNKKTQPKKKVI